MNIFLGDFETDGLDPNTSRKVEAAGILWSVPYATTIAQYSSLICGPSNAAHHINGIPPASLVEGASEASVMDRLSGFVGRAEILVFHNKDFDCQFMPPGWAQGKPVVCSMDDIVWPRSSGSKSLVAIALAHGLGVSHAHRALTDCQLIARLLERCHELGFDVQDMLRQAMRPKYMYRALVSYAEREQARLSGFNWNATTKQWTKKIAEENAGAFPFQVERVA